MYTKITKINLEAKHITRKYKISDLIEKLAEEPAYVIL